MSAMSVGDFLALCGEILLLFITVLTCVDLARVRDRARLDIALVFIALAIDVVPRLLPRLGIEPGLLTLDQPLASVVHPYLLLRLVDHFRPIRGLVSWGAMALVLAAWGFHLFAPEPIVFSWGWTVAAIFTLLTLYAAGAVASAAERGQSVIQRRMKLIAGGAFVFAVILAAQVVAALIVDLAPLAQDITRVGPLAMAALYYLGFTPPVWLSRAWQHAELSDFIRSSAGSPGESSRTALARLCSSSRHAVGGLSAAVCRWEDDRQRLVLDAFGERALVGGPIASDSLVSEHWRFRRPFVEDRASEVREACRRLAPGLDCEALIGVPLVTTSRVWGLLLIFVRRSPLMPDEELRLLSLFAEQSALALDYAALIEQLRGVEEEVEEEGFDA
jgi:GAF domain-containing protein